jgi:hypothetical protein
MLNMLFHAHSGLRFLVLLAALVALIVIGSGWAGRRPWSKAARISLSAFVGLLDLQMLLGIALVVMGDFYPRLMGHLTMMLLAVVFAHGLSVASRRAADDRRRHGLALAAVGLALLLILGGIMVIRPHPFATSGRPTAGMAATP